MSSIVKFVSDVILAAISNNTNTDRFITVWLDNEVNINEENRKAQQQLRIIINRLKTFENSNECEKYIRSISSQERILLIVSGRLGKELVPQIHNLRQVTSIYVYCKDEKTNEQWAIHFTKIKVVTSRLDKLISRIRTDQENFLLVDGNQTTSSCVAVDEMIPSISTSNFSMAYNHLLSNALLRMKSSETDKTDFIAVCNDIYRYNESELKTIHEFQKTYSSHKALWWYARESFVYRTLNKALRTKNINVILLFQFFIHDLHQQLTRYQCQHPIRVYRSQHMIDAEINSLKQSVGYLISINSLFSTGPDYGVVLSFCEAFEGPDAPHRVIFAIDADPKVVTTKPFADITKHSYFPEEREVLFSIGSLFRITNVQKNDDQVWIIRMTLCGDKDPDVKSLFEEIDKKYGCYDGEVAFISFSRVLREMKKFDEAENYCHRLLRDFSSNNPLVGILYDELAEIASSKSDYNLSEHWHQKSIQIKKKTGSSSFGNFAEGISYNDDYESSAVRGINASDSISAASSSATFAQHQSENNFRFTDVAAEKHDILLPIEGYEKMPLVTLEEAVKPLISILPDIRRKVHTANLKCKNPADGLTPDQSAAIMLYTMEWEPKDQCLYFALNADLRAADRNKLKPWFLYLKLILTGLSRLPSIQRTVYRGVKFDLSSQHQQGERFFWWGFSSCTISMNVLKSDKFLGNTGIRTLFLIECMNGKDIRRHSYYQKEDEILLLPATYFEVLSCFEMAPNLHAIQLKEIKPEFPYLEPIV